MALLLTGADELRLKDGAVYAGGKEYRLGELKRAVIQVSDLTFIEDTLRLMLEFENGTLIIPSMHPSFDDFMEKFTSAVRIDNEAYLRAMGCERTLDFVIFGEEER